MPYRTMNIYFADLNEDAKRRYLEFQKVESEDELNPEVIPIGILDREDEDTEDAG